jgi:hypothetical protein
MTRKRLPALCVPLAVAFTVALGSQAVAVIQAPTELQKFTNDASEILVLHVERVDPDKPNLVLTVDRALKGKSELTRLAINLKGDAENEKLKQTPELLKRLAPDLPVVAFLSKTDDGGYMMLGYTNGTWFQVLSRLDGEDQRWAYTHCEIYLRRTFKGTTAEMEQVLTNVLTKRKRLPPVDLKVPPGLGPVMEGTGK